MRVYSHNQFKWIDGALYLNGVDLGFQLIPFWVNEIKFYKIIWPDGVVSADFYNLTRAKDSLISHCMTELNTTGVIPHLG